MQEVKLVNRGHFSIQRVSDGAGDSGSMLVPVDRSTGDHGENGIVKVGLAIKCGSHYARSYQYQDWWMTTAVVAIYDHEENKEEGTSSCKVRTGNSVYICKGF